METLTDRITRYLLARIRRLAILDLYERAAVVGLLEADFIAEGDETSGTIWRVPEQSSRLLDAEPVKARAELERRLGKTPYKTTTLDVLMQDLPGEPPPDKARSVGKTKSKHETRAAAGPLKSTSGAAPEKTSSTCREFLALLREHIAPPVCRPCRRRAPGRPCRWFKRSRPVDAVSRLTEPWSLRVDQSAGWPFRTPLRSHARGRPDRSLLDQARRRPS